MGRQEPHAAQWEDVKSPAPGKEKADSSRGWGLHSWKAAGKQKYYLRILMGSKLTMSQQHTLVAPSEDQEALFYSVGDWDLAQVA